jgi:23S rRNA pseudouridine2605 synthase
MFFRFEMSGILSAIDMSKSGVKRSAGMKETGRCTRHGLARVISKRGLASRTQAAELIRAGKVRLNGCVVRDPEYPTDDATALIDIATIKETATDKVYLMMNKPNGLVTTRSDEKGRPTVYSLLEKVKGWVAPVGRLDMASEGLLFFTNDTAWANRICDPQTRCEKTYHVQIDRIPGEALLAKMTEGIVDQKLGELNFAKVSVLREGEKNCWLEVTLDEGKNRQIRRVLEALGMKVLRLVRVSIGSVKLGALPKGSWRALTRKEYGSF